jgi:hypothetical protein
LALVLVGMGFGYLLGRSSHHGGPPAPFEATVTRVALDNFSVCVKPTAGGSEICDPLFTKAGSKPPVAGETAWFAFAYDRRGNSTYTLLVQARPGG